MMKIMTEKQYRMYIEEAKERAQREVYRERADEERMRELYRAMDDFRSEFNRRLMGIEHRLGLDIPACGGPTSGHNVRMY